MDKQSETKVSRRVYAPELRRRLGIGETWLKRLEESGRIPPARTDPGGKRGFWLDDEADAIVAGTRSTVA